MSNTLMDKDRSLSLQYLCYYDPVAGIFLSADTKEGNAQGMNPYAYVAQNPETLTDPSGQMIECGPGGCGGGNNNPGNGNNNGNGGMNNPGAGGNTGCSEDSCSVTLGSGKNRHTYDLNDIQNIKERENFLDAFYSQLASGFGTAELDFFNFLLNSGRLLHSAYWNSVDYQLARDQLLSAYDFLHGVAAQSLMVNDWLTFLDHPTNDGWWTAHDTSIDVGDHLARADGLYARESGDEQHFINETINVINQIQVVSQGSWNPLGKVFSPQAPTTGFLSNIFYPKQYNDTSTLASFSNQASTVLAIGSVGGPLGMITGAVGFIFELN